MRSPVVIAACALCVVWTTISAQAQSLTERGALASFERDKTAEYFRQARERDSIAAARGLAILQHLADGTMLYLERFENGEPYYLAMDNAVASATIHTDETRAVYGLDGNGIAIAMWDNGGVHTGHPELAGGRVTQMDGAPLDTAVDHATHVAGTLVATGIVPEAKGMATRSIVRAYDAKAGDTFRMSAEARSNALLLSNHSYGNVAGWYKGKWYGDASIHPKIDYKYGYYDARAHDWDSLAVLAPQYLIVKAAGNFRGDGGPIQPPPSGAPENNGGASGYDCLPTYSVAKNALTVGAVDGRKSSEMTTFSAFGPTDDGRIKPDLVAHGEAVYSCSHVAPLNKPNGYSTNSGTSQAAPSVTGSAALLLQLQKRLLPGTALLSSTLKGLLIHTSEDRGAPGPDYQFGWGIANTKAAADLIAQEAACGGHLFNNGALAAGDDTLRVRVQSDGTPLKATICWIDPPAVPIPIDTGVCNNPSPRLVHDLDLRVNGAAGTALPWILKGLSDPSAVAVQGDNVLDNVEQVFIPAPVAGEFYTISITHKRALTRTQSVSLIVTGNCTATADAGPDLEICHESSARIGAVATCGNLPYTYDWEPKDSTLSAHDVADPVLRIANPSTVPVLRMYIVTVTDTRGCTAVDTVTVRVLPQVRVAVAGDTAICEGGSILMNGSVTGGSAPFRYSWSPPQFLSDPAIADPVATPTATTAYVLTVTDAKGCTVASRPVLVTVHPKPPVPLVTRSDDTLRSTPALRYQWFRDAVPLPGRTQRDLLPDTGGAYAVEVTDSNGCSARSASLDIGMCTVELPSIEAAPGERVTIPLRIRSASHLAAAGARSFTASIRFRKDALMPEAPFVGTENDSDRVVEVSGLYRGTGDTLAGGVYLAMLGEHDRSVLHLERFAWNTAQVRTTLVDGDFRLSVCREGGVRLFSGDARLQLRQNRPNPFNASTVIDYELIEAGPVELTVCDLLGRRVATLVSASPGPGSYRAVFDAGALPTGMYVAILQTAAQRAVRTMQVVK
ncbi:MAG: S8 family peptidase [Ignavibacteria bacterium]|nr:S8 family peptidase [Ignavibacteria bacterium]